MASKSHDLTARVILQGQVDNSFTQIGAQLENLGNQLLRTNRWVINFGKESLDAFVDFDDAMRDARYAFQDTYKGSASQFESDMDKMTKNAMDLAERSIYSTLEIGTAYSKAAHAGKDFWEADYLVGAAEKLASTTNGAMSLDDAMDSLIVIMNAAGLSMEDAYDIVDMLVHGGNLADTTVAELTQAMVRMGPALKFFHGDMADAVAMIDAFAQNGVKGTEAGTAMRMIMLRLLAPTNKAADVMGALGLSAEEYAEAMEDVIPVSEESMKILENYGFSAYENGHIKDITQIWGELSTILSKMSEEEATQVLTDIFGNRRATGAKILVDDYEKLADYSEDIAHNSAGAADEAKKIMQGGIGGEFRRIEATENALQTRVGSFIADDIMPFLTTLEDVLKWIYELDDTAMAPIIAFFETLVAGAGSLVAVGGAMKLIGTAIGTIAGGPWVMAAVAIAALVSAAGTYAEEARQDKLGDMSLTMSTFADTFERLANAYDGKYADLALYNEQMTALIGNYTTMSEKFSQGLWDMLINGSGMSDDDRKAKEKEIIDGVEGMGDTLREANEESRDVALNYASTYAADDNTGIWGQIQDYINLGYEETLNDINAKSWEIRKAVLSGFEGGLTEEEIANIMQLVGEYDQIMADMEYARSEADIYEMLYNNRTISYDSLDAFYGAMMGPRDEKVANIMERNRIARANALAGVNAKAEAEGWDEARIREEKLAVTGALNEARNEEVLGTQVEIGNQMLSIFKTAMLTSKYNTQGYTDLNWMGEGAADLFKYAASFVDAIGIDTLEEMAKTNKDAQDVLSLYNRWTFAGSKAGEDFGKTFGFDIFGWVDDLVDFGTAFSDTFFGTKLNVPVDLDARESISEIESTPITMKVNFEPTTSLGGGEIPPAYAEGGRADRASIFGENGAEWAIPEEHSSRTAELLRMAAAASGFTWGELLSRNGGLNAGGGQPVTVVYSPTINANDASGVRDELIADKGRLEKWFRERELKESLVSYA